MTKIPISDDTLMYDIFAMEDWCINNFGPCIMDSRNRWISGRWHLDGDNEVFKFTHSKDALRFTLKWII